MVKKVEYEKMDFMDKGRVTKRQEALNEVMDYIGLPRYLGELYLYEVKLNLENELESTKNILRVKGFID